MFFFNYSYSQFLVALIIGLFFPLGFPQMALNKKEKKKNTKVIMVNNTQNFHGTTPSVGCIRLFYFVEFAYIMKVNEKCDC